MSLNEENVDCGAAHQEMMIKTEASGDDLNVNLKMRFDDSFLSSWKLKCENGQEDSSYHQSCELKNLENTTLPDCSIKTEPEDSGDDVLAELKEEEIDIEEHRPHWELIAGTSNSFVIVKKELDYAPENQLQFSDSTSEGKQYNCAHCKYKTNCRRYFIKHWQCIHSRHARVYKCEECSYETKNKHHFTEHHKHKHSKDAKMYKCQECSLETKYKRHLTQHYKHKHLKIEAKDAKVFKCQECSFETKHKSSLTKHYKYKHEKEAEVYKCVYCSYETRIKDCLNKHFKCKHSKDAATVYKCEVCCYETKVKHNFNQHKYRHKYTFKKSNSIQV